MSMSPSLSKSTAWTLRAPAAVLVIRRRVKVGATLPSFSEVLNGVVVGRCRQDV